MQKILIIDDNLDGGNTLKIYLQLLGYQMTLVSTGTAALESFADETYDFIILDIGLPDMTGYEVARQIRAMPKGDLPFILAASGWNSESDKIRVLEAGCNMHRAKPLDLEELSKLIQSESTL
jgi:DNA-binding response OmpR family regulator